MTAPHAKRVPTPSCSGRVFTSATAAGLNPRRSLYENEVNKLGGGHGFIDSFILAGFPCRSGFVHMGFLIVKTAHTIKSSAVCFVSYHAAHIYLNNNLYRELA